MKITDVQTVLNAFWDRRLRPLKEPVLHPPETDTPLVEIRPWPAASAAAINAKVGGEDAEEGRVIHFAPDGQPHAYEIEHASARPELVARALNALHAAKGYVAA